MFRATFVTAALVALSACGGEGTGPSSSLNVVVSVSSLRGPAVTQLADGTPRIDCAFDLTAVASGTGTGTWLDGSFIVYVGKDKATPVDSSLISREEIRQSWNKSTIGGGETQHSTWTLSAGIPFTADLVFTYQASASAEVKSTKMRIACSPPVAADAPAPAITALTIVPPSGKLPVGAPLTVSYTASAAAGLWLTAVHVSGPCEVWQYLTERFAPTSTHSLSLKLPIECKLGVPITVGIGAVDAAVQSTVRSEPLSLVLADEEPPRVSPIFFGPLGNASSVASGDYFAGDSISMSMGATDNYALAALIWEVLPFGAKDSVVVSGQGVGNLKIPLRPEWTGNIQLRLYARDAMGLTSNVVTTPADSLRVRPTVQRPTRVATLAGQFTEFVIDQRRGLLYLQPFAPRVTVVSLATLQITNTIPLPGTALDLDLTPSGDTLLVAMSGQRSLAIVDLRQPVLASTTLPLDQLDQSLGQYATQVRSLANGHAMLGIVGNAPSASTLLDVNLGTGAQRLRPDAAVNGLTGEVHMGRSADGGVLIVGESAPRCVRRYVTATDAFGDCAAVRSYFWYPTVDSTGQRFALDTDVYDASMTLLPKSGPIFAPGGVAYSLLSPDGQSLFKMLTIPGILRFDATTGMVLDKTPMPPLMLLTPPRLSADGKTMVLLERGNSATRIAVIDLR
jgi:hypothetical protein